MGDPSPTEALGSTGPPRSLWMLYLSLPRRVCPLFSCHAVICLVDLEQRSSIRPTNSGAVKSVLSFLTTYSHPHPTLDGWQGGRLVGRTRPSHYPPPYHPHTNPKTITVRNSVSLRTVFTDWEPETGARQLICGVRLKLSVSTTALVAMDIGFRYEALDCGQNAIRVQRKSQDTRISLFAFALRHSQERLSTTLYRSNV